MKKVPFKTVKELQEHFKQLNADALAWRSFSEWLDGQDNMTQYGCNFISMLELKRLRKEWQKGKP
jgi:hypothetical protein